MRSLSIIVRVNVVLNRTVHVLTVTGVFRSCLHGGGGPQVGEVTRLGGVTRLSM